MDQFRDEIQTINEILKNTSQGMSITDIARAMKKNKHSVGRYLDNMLISGQVEMRTYGKAKVYTRSTRVPLDTILGYAEDLIFVLDQDSRIVRINPQGLDFIKKTRNELIGKNIQFLTFSESRISVFFEKIRASLASGILDEEILLPGNEERIFRKKLIPTVFEDGRKGMTILLEDITKKKEAEKALRASEERFRLMAENIQDGITIWEEKKITYMNQRAEEIFGYSKKELSLMSPADLAVPQERQRLQEIISRSMESKSIPSDLKFWIERKDGSQRFILNRITSVRHTKGVTCYIITTDFTEWKDAHDALENQLGFLQHMINTYPNPLFYRDLQGRFLGCNTAFSNLIGRSCDEISGKTSEDLLGNNQAVAFLKHDEDLMNEGDLFTYSSVFTRPDGPVCRLGIQKSRLFLANGKTAGTVGLILTMEDISRVKPL